MAESAEHLAPDRRARFRNSFGKTTPCVLMAPVERKICRECNVLQVPIQIIPWNILRGESQTVGNSPLA